MAVTILTTPQFLTPAYNPILFTFSGNNTTKIGFKYLVDTYNATTNQFILRQRIPLQLDNTGKVDLSRLLNNFVDVDYPLTGTTPNLTTKSKFDYFIRIGEEYAPDAWNFTTAITGATGTTLSSNTTAHQYNVQDVIQITFISGQSTGYTEYQTITAITNANAFRITPSAYITGGTTGVTSLVGGGTKQFTGLTTSAVFSCFNGVKTFENFRTWSGANFVLSAASTTKEALTELPTTNFRITPTQDVILNFYISGTTGDTFFVKGVSDTNVTATTSNFVLTTGGTAIVQFKVGFGNLGFTGSNINSYSIALYKTPNTQFTKTYTYSLDRRCRINPTEIIFMARMGSLPSFAFSLRQYENGTIHRTQYKKQVADINQIYDWGNQNINVNFDKIYTLTTDFMTEEMSIFFEHLLTTPYAWVKFGSQYLACTIEDSAFEVVHQNNKRLINYSIKIKLANSNNTNI